LHSSFISLVSTYNMGRGGGGTAHVYDTHMYTIPIRIVNVEREREREREREMGINEVFVLMIYDQIEYRKGHF